MSQALELIDTEIRPATEADLPRIVALGRAFYRDAWEPEFRWSEPSIMVLLKNMLSSGILFVSEQDGEVQGMIGGFLAPFPYVQEIIIGQELFWWVDPSARGHGLDLLDTFETEARARGAWIVAMSLMEQMRGDVLSRLYERRGYRLLERSFMKVL
jgi:GNAT superfamily N-acetyltransferase